MDMKERVELVRSVLLLVHRRDTALLRDQLSLYNQSQRKLKRDRAEATGNLLRQVRRPGIRDVDVMGCTVVGASIHRSAIVHAKPWALVIEEAAEIPEPSLVAALVPSLERIVMIGDHKQLRASVACYELKKQKHLDVSAFERLVDNGVKVVTLNTQNRMRENVLGPVRLHYPNITSNLDIIGKLPPPPWFVKPLYWWDHTREETVVTGRSRANEYEADRAISLCTFLIQQGVPPTDITVLTPYTGQVLEIRARVKRYHKGAPSLGMCGIEVKSVDEFQGSENRYVVLSLVRSSPIKVGSLEKPNIGFLREVNRCIVATSRQKLALVIVGNAEVLSGSAAWKKLVDLTKELGACSTKLHLKCPRHGKVIELEHPLAGRDFFGCGETCGMPHSECDHPCKGKCHGPNRKHQRCQVKKEHKFSRCGHTVTIECGQSVDGLRCREMVAHGLPCGHKKQVFCCDVSSGKVLCDEPCRIVLPCGHPCNLRCGAPCSSRACPACAAKAISALKLSAQSLKQDALMESVVDSDFRRSLAKTKTPNFHGTELKPKHLDLLASLVRTYNTAIGVEAVSVALWRRICQSKLFIEDFPEGMFDHPEGVLYHEGGLQERIEIEEHLLQIVLDELRVPYPQGFWSQIPLVWAWLGLVDVLVPDTLNTIRSVYRSVLELRPEDETKRSSLPPLVLKIIRRIHDVLRTFIEGTNGSSRYCAFTTFAQESMQTLAAKVSQNLGVGRVAVGFPTKNCVKVARRYGLMPALQSVSEATLPHQELPHSFLWLPENSGKTFITIDLRKADFVILRLVDPSLAAYCDEWSDFVREVFRVEQETHPERDPPLPCFEQLKALRTRVLGKLCHEKNAALQKHLLRLVSRAIVSYAAGASAREHERSAAVPQDVSFSVARIFSWSNDELFIECRPGKHKEAKTLVEQALSLGLRCAKPITRIQTIRLVYIPYSKSMEDEIRDIPESELIEEQTVLRRGHAALQSRFVEPEYRFDHEWRENGDRVPVPPKTGFWVRVGLEEDRGMFSVKMLPRSLLLQAYQHVFNARSTLTAGTQPQACAISPVVPPPVLQQQPRNGNGGKKSQKPAKK